MKVLLIATKYQGGGAIRHSRELFDRLPALGVEPTMLVADRTPGDPPNVYGARLPGEKYLRLFERPSRPIDWRHVGSRRFLNSVKSGDYDLVHLHNLHGGWLSLTAVAEITRRIPTVWSLHDEWAVHDGLAYDLSVYADRWWLDQAPGAQTLLRGNPVAEGVMRHVRAHMPKPRSLITYSQYMHRLVSESPRWRGVPNRLVRYGVTMLDAPARTMPREAARKALGVGPAERTVLLIANHLSSPFKGMPLAVRALRSLPADAFTCLLVGSECAQLAAQIPQRSVQLNYISNAERLATAYRAADVMIFPSTSEAFGLVSAEALACETPVVGFAVGGISEQIGSNERGRLVPPLDTQGLAAAIAELLANPAECERLGRAGRAWVEQSFRMERSVEGTVQAYRDTLAMAGTTSAA